VVQAIDRGGLEMMAVDLAIALHRRGIRSSVLALTEGGRLEARLREAGVPLEVGGGARYLSPASHLSVARVLTRLRPTVLHTHHLPSLLNAGPFAKLAGLPRVVHTEHARLYLDEQPRMRTLLRVASRMADSVALVGAALVPYYVDTVGIAAGRLRVVPNGVDTDRFAPIPPGALTSRRAAAGLPNSGLVVGAVGRLAHVKNYSLLLRAVASLRAQGVELSAVLVGDGEDREDLERLAAELGVHDAIHFLGWRTDVAELVGLFDVLAVTSFSEGLPLVVLEAMSAGVAVVSTNVGEIPRVLDEGRAGVLVPSDDALALAAALRRFALDGDGRRAFGRRARDRALAGYSMRAMVDAYSELYGLAPAARAA
jgi:glycosyltransferase involved in cell wall biosynthesis